MIIVVVSSLVDFIFSVVDSSSGRIVVVIESVVNGSSVADDVVEFIISLVTVDLIASVVLDDTICLFVVDANDSLVVVLFFLAIDVMLMLSIISGVDDALIFS
jgi:hypothetical protein